MKPRYDGPLCPHCKRWLMEKNGKCLCCGHPVK